ncbi:hypothetical protein PPACK8108_LOCUS10590 [Phakopsora pachyrhizi]|uniref:Uncharacterized protein n=1 Tax=Phakopsora pachyrhizi TaxID=170000 RepID=A0AAV0B1K3_PHAPC|nr:hypothetical protein PPACK8108_LOCUS10590 [Phakopsora pachyrhizi]
MHNCWSKGVANILNELSVKDHYDILNYSFKNYVNYYFYRSFNFRSSNNEFRYIYEVLDFFKEPQALDKLSNSENLPHSEKQLTKSVARTLINIVSVPKFLDYLMYSCIWSFAYYIVEFLVTDQSSRFLELYQEQIEKSSLMEKIDLIKKFITLKKEANQLLPSKLNIMTRKSSEVWKRLGDDRIVKWFDQYFVKLNKLDKDFKSLKNQIENHLSVYKKLNSHPELNNRSHKQYISCQLGGLLNTKIIGHFLSKNIVKSKLIKSERKKHLKMIKFAIKRKKVDTKNSSPPIKNHNNNQKNLPIRIKNKVKLFLKNGFKMLE